MIAHEKSMVVALLALCGGVFIAAGCGQEECAVCPECPACTLVTSFDLNPVVDGYAIDGYCYQHLCYLKDEFPDLFYPSSKLIVKNNTSSLDDYNTECRSFMEFDITAVTGSVVAASLELVMDTFTGLSFPVTLICHTYAGDGVCTIKDFSRCAFGVDTVTYNREWVVTFDVSDALRTRVAAGDTCAGFNIGIYPPTVIENGGPSVVFRSIEAGPPARLTVTQSIISEPPLASDRR